MKQHAYRRPKIQTLYVASCLTLFNPTWTYEQRSVAAPRPDGDGGNATRRAGGRQTEKSLPYL